MVVVVKYNEDLDNDTILTYITPILGEVYLLDTIEVSGFSASRDTVDTIEARGSQGTYISTD